MQQGSFLKLIKAKHILYLATILAVLIRSEFISMVVLFMWMIKFFMKVVKEGEGHGW